MAFLSRDAIGEKYSKAAVEFDTVHRFLDSAYRRPRCGSGMTMPGAGGDTEAPAWWALSERAFGRVIRATWAAPQRCYRNLVADFPEGPALAQQPKSQDRLQRPYDRRTFEASAPGVEASQTTGGRKTPDQHRNGLGLVTLQRSRTQEELQLLLAEQVEWLESSARLFDAGRTHEAKRLAVTIRVLLHDTSMSKSLLSQLDLKDRLLFLDTAGPVNRRNLLPLTPLISFRMTQTKDGPMPSYQPVYLDGPRPESGLRALRFHDWWTMMVLRDAAMEEYSRRDLVLYLANKVGGAHVDPDTQERLGALARSETVGFSVADGRVERRIEDDPILPYLRQIAFEVTEVLRVRQWIPGTEPRP